MSKQWKIRPFNHAASQKLADALRLPAPLAKILTSRGYATPEQASAFLYAALDDLSRPFMLPNMGAAVEKIGEAMKLGKRIAIYGDYDVDGICASVLMQEVFSWLGQDVCVYIPSRLKEGYGMNASALEALQREGIEFVITVDNGIASHDLIKAYTAKGMTFVVTDHHQLPEVLPECIIVNPLLSENIFLPYRSLCGCGTAYFLAMGMLVRLAPTLYDDAHKRKLLDLVAVATVADIVPLTGDNRILVREGLKVINTTPRPGLKALAALMCGEERVKASDIAFRIAPCINACGRLDHTSDALALFQAKPVQDMGLLAETVRGYNDARKDLEQSITKEAISQFESFKGHMHIAVAVGENWHPGVIGIVASRLVEHFHCPAIVLTATAENPDVYTGSARSVEGFHLFHALQDAADHLLQFGGHEMAAGLSLEKSQLADFKTAIFQLAADFEAERPEDMLWIDAVIKLEDATSELEEALRLLEPCGAANPEPLFALEHQRRFTHQAVGKDGAHLKLRFNGKDGEGVSAIAFRKGQYAFQERHYYDFAFHIGENCFQGVCDVQLMISEIMPSWQAAEPKMMQTIMSQGAAYSESSEASGIADKPSFHTKLRGVTFADRKELIAGLAPQTPILLAREENNPADANAIACVLESGERIGYLSRAIAAQLAPLIDLGARYEAEVTAVTGLDKAVQGVNLLVKRVTEEAYEKTAAAEEAELSELDEEHLTLILTDAFIDDGELLPIQKAAIANITERHEDTCVIMPTGRGKSLIYQMAAGILARRDRRMSIVILPLKALLNDQLLSLSDTLAPLGYCIRKGCGDLNTEERATLFAELASGSIDVLFLTPEFFLRHQKAILAQAARVGQIVIDEAHYLVSQRAAYKKLPTLKTAYPNAVWTYLTATVPQTEADAFRQIISGAGLYIDDHIRYNLHIHDARHTEQKLVYLYRLFMHPQKTICYVNSRKQAFALARRLRELLPYTLRPLVSYYHGGLPKEARRSVEKAFKEGDVRLLFATTAFGEGVHIPDIRNVVLYHPCFSVEAFNQLAGRCARDGEDGWIHLLYGEKDCALNEMIVERRAPSREKLGKMYQRLKIYAKEKDYVLRSSMDALYEELEGLLEGSTRAQWRLALTIFEELDFLKRQGTPSEMVITVEANPRHRNLNESATYVEGMGETRALAEFEKMAFMKDIEILESVIRSALKPADWQGREVKP